MQWRYHANTHEYYGQRAKNPAGPVDVADRLLNYDEYFISYWFLPSLRGEIPSPQESAPSILLIICGTFSSKHLRNDLVLLTVDDYVKEANESYELSKRFHYMNTFALARNNVSISWIVFVFCSFSYLFFFLFFNELVPFVSFIIISLIASRFSDSNDLSTVFFCGSSRWMTAQQQCYSGYIWIRWYLEQRSPWQYTTTRPCVLHFNNQ